MPEEDIIEKAMDAAEVEIESKDPIEEAVEAEIVVPEKVKEKKRPYEKKTPEPESEPQEAEPAVEAAPVPAQPEPASELPQFWPAKLKAAASKAPKEALQEFLQYDQQRTEWANRVAGESRRGKEIEQRAQEVFKPYEAKLRMAGVRDHLEASERLLAWNSMLTSDNMDERKQAITLVMRQAGLSPEHFFEDAQAQPQEQFHDPRIDEALEAAEAARNKLAEWEQRQAAQSAQAEIAKFRAGKDSTGADREPFVQMFEPQIAEALTAIKAEMPDMPQAEQLHHAYEFVMQRAREAGILAQPQRQQKAPAAKAIAAASSVTGSPGGAVAPQRNRAKGKDFNERLDNAIDEALDGAGIR